MSLSQDPSPRNGDAENPPQPATPASDPADQVETVEESIDAWQHCAAYRQAIEAACDLAKGRGSDEIRLEDLPERFRADFDPAFDDSNQLEADEALYSGLLTSTIRRASKGSGPVASHVDRRTGLRWVALPPGMIFSGPGLDDANSELMPDAGPTLDGSVIAFKVERPVIIPAGWVKAADLDYRWTVDDDGRLGVMA